jgi:hypothetical protein
MTREDLEHIILEWSLWGMDDTPYRVMANKMVTTRAPAECAICLGAIAPGSRVRAQSEVYDGKAKTFRVCPTCCDAILLDSLDGDCLRMEVRTQIGMGMARDAVDPHADSTGKPTTRV